MSVCETMRRGGERLCGGLMRLEILGFNNLEKPSGPNLPPEDTKFKQS